MVNKITKYLKGLSLLGLVALSGVSNAQEFSSSDYDKALWMTTRFYGAQRSGETNWALYNHLPAGVEEKYRGTAHIEDSDGAYDLSGGWHDCGDHVKFGQTQYYSGYMLLKAFDEFPTGFDDYYSYDFNGYTSSNDYTWEGGKGKPNGIPDVLDEAKHATDYFIKCAKNSSTFYNQVGNGGSGADHTHIITPTLMQTLPANEGGQDRPIHKNPADAPMASFCSAALSVMSRAYAKYDPEYAALCLEHAKYAYDYAEANKGSTQSAPGFYGANDNTNNSYAIMVTEMYWATNDEAYKTKALNLPVSTNTDKSKVSVNQGYTFDYANNGEMALYVLAKLGSNDAKVAFNTQLESKWIPDGNYNSEGVYTNGGSWGSLRYVGNAGLIVSLYSKLNGSTTLNDKVFSNIDYLMGSNNNDRSFIVGFEPTGKTSAQHPHHRVVYLNDEYLNNTEMNSTLIPTKNKQFGALVGGSLSSGEYTDKWSEYVNSEVCVDYNVGLVGALGAIKAQLAAVDTNKFNAGTKPDLGDDQSICGVSQITLNANVPTDGVKKFTWYKNDQVVKGPSTSANTYIATAAGDYKVELDSLDEWTTQSTVVISGVLETIDLGGDFELCDPASKVLVANVSGAGVSYLWTQDGNEIGTEQSYEVREAGTYKVVASASGCASVTDQVLVGSLLPQVIDGYSCNGGNGTMQVISDGGSYVWYDQAVDGIEKETGESYTTNVLGTYYVEDQSSFSTVLGPTASTGTFTNWGVKEYKDGFYLEFSTTTNFSIDALSVSYKQIYNDQTAVVAVEIRNASGELKGTFVSDSKSLTSTDNGLLEFTFTDFNIQSSWGEDLIMSLNAAGTTVDGMLVWDKGGSYSFPYSDNSNSVSITGAITGQTGSNYVFFYDWEITAGNACARIPVKLIDDCITSNEFELAESNVSVYPNPFTNTTNITLPEGNYTIDVIDMNGNIVDGYSLNGTSLTLGSELTNGVYVVKVKGGNNTQQFKLIKE